MKRATITLSEDLERQVAEFLNSQDPEPSLTALVQAALRHYLAEAAWMRRAYQPPSHRLAVTRARSGQRTTAGDHDAVLAKRS